MSIAEKLTTIAENVPRVFDAGKKSQYDEFWDAYQNGGVAKKYQYAFNGDGWTDITFKPKYDIICELGQNSGSIFLRSAISDLEQILIDCGVILDTSGSTDLSYLFSYSAVTVVPEIDASGSSTLYGSFSNATKLTIIRNLILKEDGSQNVNAAFTNCYALEDITIEGKFGQDISFAKSSKLNYQSLKNIIDALYNYSGTSTTRTLTLHADSKTLLNSTAEGVAAIAQANANGWTIA